MDRTYYSTSRSRHHGQFVQSSRIQDLDNNNDNDDDDRRRRLFQQRSKRWVVLVDDEESIRKAVGQYLFDEGYQVTACPDAKTALHVCRTKRTTTTDSNSSGGAATMMMIPDLIVSDVRMPEMDGIEFLNELRRDERLVSVPVVLLTARGMIQDRIAGYRAGADAYIPKPFDPEELLSIIDNSIKRHETLNEENVLVEDLQQDLEEIKHLLLEHGGAGVGNGWVEETNVFLAPDENVGCWNCCVRDCTTKKLLTKCN
ncbi:cheY-homologous receiver domain [Fragilaria crotonensis]|nr:cheY-homologous receiver domain [Fragilaria crotonensis]